MTEPALELVFFMVHTVKSDFITKNWDFRAS